MNIYLGLGSNLADPMHQIHSAITAIAQLPKTQISGVSRLYQTKPVGHADQPDFINAAVRLSTELSARELLQHCQAIERSHGRVRVDNQNAARTLDIDLLLFGDDSINEPELIVPHPRMFSRAFVLYPLYDIDPDLAFPDGTNLEALLEQVPMDGVRLFEVEVSA